MANYSVGNFLAVPTSDDTMLRIYDKTNKLKYTIDPSVSYFFSKANVVIIKIEDRNDITLDFANSTEAAQALAKLNDYKKILLTPKSESISGGTSTVYSKSNLNMSALVTVNDGDLACTKAISDPPKTSSFVKVFVNGIEVNVGGKVYPYDCYFSADNGVTARALGNEKHGDLLYWNGTVAGYNLDTIDLIDFNYLTIISI